MRPAASAASPTSSPQRIVRYLLARLRPDVDQRGLTGLHRRDCLLDRGAKLGRVLDRTCRPPAHGLRELWYSISGFSMLVPIGPMSFPRFATRLRKFDSLCT